MLANEELSSNPFDAARAGLCEDILTFLCDEVDIDEPNKQGNTMLMLAAWYGHEDAVELLLQKGASPTFINANGSSVLQYGSRNSKVLSLLLNTPAAEHINHQDDDGITPLIQATNIVEGVFKELDLALIPDRIVCVEALLAAGADINLASDKGRTALMNAAFIGDAHLVEALLLGNPDVGIVCAGGKRAVEWASSEKVAQMLGS
ncbi:ankyrin repeat domain-containing protein [Pseudomonas putida]|uniref:Ankyrin repeat domain-containing protein n=1 Tax=Pseudomonas putida TaxID=303 RepID=A0A8I1EGK0_PSEPU|nr:ankyrin repeat domain-containing protein [Pseudomonas putida]MBI6885116.1 ankyrin repeat domain-containing protein [Pseudomonas putida]